MSRLPASQLVWLVVLLHCGASILAKGSAGISMQIQRRYGPDDHSHHVARAARPSRLAGSADGDDVGADGAIEVLSLFGRPSIAYAVNMAIGTPAQNIMCLVDTGSSNLAVAGAPGDGVDNWFDKTSSSTERDSGKDDFGVKYVSGQWTANRVSDVVGFAGGANAAINVEFGSIFSSDKFFRTGDGSDGIIGMAFEPLAQPAKDPVEPYLTTMWRQHPDLRKVFGMQLCDFDSPDKGDYGRMVIGADISGQQVIGEYFYTNLTGDDYYDISVRGMKVGGEEVAVPCGLYNTPRMSIVDSGTTVLSVPEWVHGNITAKLDLPIHSEADKAAFYNGKACAYFSDDLIDGMKNITLTVASDIPGKQLDLHIVPRHYLRGMQDRYGEMCYSFSILPACGPAGVVLGIALMDGYITVFDRQRQRVGFATSACGFSDRGLAAPYAIPEEHRHDTCQTIEGFKCPSIPNTPLPFRMNTWMWVAVGAGVVVLILLIVLGVQTYQQRRRRRGYTNLQQGPSAPREGANMHFAVGNASSTGAATLDDGAMTVNVASIHAPPAGPVQHSAAHNAYDPAGPSFT